MLESEIVPAGKPAGAAKGIRVHLGFHANCVVCGGSNGLASVHKCERDRTGSIGLPFLTPYNDQ